MNEKKNSLSTYLTTYLASDAELIKQLGKDFEDHGRYSESLNTQNPIASTWLINFKQIENESEKMTGSAQGLAKRYLYFMFCVAAQDIPCSLLPAAPPRELEDAIALLEKYAFISPSKNKGSYDIHCLVQLAGRNWLESEGEWTRYSEIALLRVEECFPLYNPDCDSLDTKALCYRYLPHAEVLLRIENSKNADVALRRLFNKVGTCQYQTGQYRKAEATFTKRLVLEQRAITVDHFDHLMALTNLAETYRALRKYQAAESMHRDALQLAENAFGQENEFTLIAISNLAVTLNAMNKVREAEKLQKHMLKLMGKTANPERPDMLRAQGDLAQTLSKQGKQAEAVQIQREIVRVQKRVEASHPSTLNSMNNLAAMLGDQQNFKEAEEVYLETFEAEKKILGNQHSYTSITMINLADIYRNLEKNGESERMQRDALELSQEVLGPDHPTTLSSLQNLLLLLRQQGMDEEARKLEGKHKAFGSADA